MLAHRHGSLPAEITQLKAELAGKVQDRDTPYKGSKPADVQELQEKLQRLRKEQQEADAARDKAWKQLKVHWRAWWAEKTCVLCLQASSGSKLALHRLT